VQIMAGLPKKYARMGFKKGWLAFKRLRKKSRKVQPMARKRRNVKRFFKRTSRKAKGFLTFGNISKVLIGAGLCVLYEVYVSPMIPLDGMIKNIVELGAGLLLASMGSMPMPVRAFGAALATINAFTILTPLITNFTGGSSDSNMSTSWG